MTEPETHKLEVPGAVLRYDVRAERAQRGPLLRDDRLADGRRRVRHAGVVLHRPHHRDLRPAGRRAQRADRPARGDPRGARGRRGGRDRGGRRRPVDVFASSGGAVNALALVAAPARPGRRRSWPTSRRWRACCRTPPRPSPPAGPSTTPTTARLGRRHGALHRAGLAAGTGPGRLRLPTRARPGDVRHAHRGRRRPRRPDARVEHHAPITHYRPDTDRACGPRRPPPRGRRGAGSDGELAHRGGEAVAELLGTQPVTFPGDHGGFLGGEYGQTGEPDAFAARLREVLADER